MTIQQIIPLKAQSQRLQKAGLVLFACALMFSFSDNTPAADVDNEPVAKAKSKAKPQAEKKQQQNDEATQLSDVNVSAVTQRAHSLVGIAASASQGNIGQEQLRYRPMTRPSEILETVPGMIASQHSGEGKASQYYLRGFNLDHGTDFLTQVDGAPVNMPSHSHGQGWMDTNFLIPEMIKTVSYQKGNYYADTGDFSSTGSANIQYFDKLDGTTVKFTGGSFDYYRGLVMGSTKLGDGNLAYAGETVHNNGPWQSGNEYMKFNGVLRYSQGDVRSGWSITGMAYKADWGATDQIPKRAVATGLIDRFGALDSTDGGASQRYSLTGEWHQQDKFGETKFMAYGIYSKLRLFSNFTYYLNNPDLSDQFAQPDERWTTGFKASHTLYHKLAGADSETTFGLQFRNDNINNALHLTQARQTYDIVRKDTMAITTISPYIENKTHWNDWFRTSLGVRFDQYRMEVARSNQADNNGVRYASMASPKLGLTFGPWAKTEFYLNGGLGFHSNDARGVNTQVDPVTGSTLDANGNTITRAKLLSRTYGAEIGARTTYIKGLQSTLAVWWLDIDSELLFSGDAGTTEPSRPSRRYGVEFANYYSPTDWLTFDADVSFSKARFRGNSPLGNHIPGSVAAVVAGGATIHDVWGGFFGGPRIRYFGPRALIEDNSVRSSSTTLISATIGYKFNKNWTAQAEVFNLLNRRDSGIDYYYVSRLPGEPAAGVGDVHFHPIEPLSFRMSVSANF